MSLIQQWANNIGASKPVNDSWIEAIAESYEATLVSDNILLDIAIRLRAIDSNGNLYQSIAIKLSNNQSIQPLNGSYLERIVELTEPK